MKTTKAQRKRLYNENPGYGWIVFNRGNEEITEIEIFVGKDRVMRRVGNGNPLFPLQMLDEEVGYISIESGD